MKEITAYNNLVIDLRYKDFLKEAVEFAKEDNLIKEKRFKVKSANASLDHGIVLSHEKGVANVIINQASIRYIATNIPFIATYSLQELFDRLKEVRWRMSKNDDIEYTGVMAIVSYVLSEEDKFLVKNRFDENLAGVETRITFDNEKGIHFIVGFLIKDGLLTIQIDANSRGLKKQEDFNIDIMIQEIGKFAMNPQDLFEKIQLPIGKDLPRSLDYIIERANKKYEEQ